MDQFINSLEEDNFDLDGFVSYVADNVEDVKDGQLSGSQLASQRKEELNTIWQSKLNKFLECQNECKISGASQEKCNHLSVDFYNFTFSLYFISYDSSTLIYLRFTKLEERNPNLLSLERCVEKNTFSPVNCIPHIKKCWNDMENLQ